MSDHRRVARVALVKLFSNLNLNGATPVRVQPRLGEWGPDDVPSTRSKKRTRVVVAIAFPVAALCVFLLGWFVYYLMTGHLGFGLDH